MKCPRCNAGLNRQDALEDKLKAVTCRRCEGHWISSDYYWAWHDSLEPGTDTVSTQDIIDVPDQQGEKGKLCPECRSILLPGKVGHGHEFRIDRCGGCGGFWLDRNEWEALSPYFSRAFYCDAPTVRPDRLSLRRAARQSVGYACAALGRENLP